MIISKENALNNKIKEAHCRLRELLETKRGSSEARVEMMKLRELSFDTNECPYCKRQIVSRSPRRPEACDECAKKIDRLLMTKSKILNSLDGILTVKAMQSFVDDLSSLHHVPCSLSGDKADMLLDACNSYLVSISDLEAYRKSQRRVIIADNLRNKRLAELRKEYSKWSDRYTQEELEEIVQMQYVQRYHQEIV